MQVALHFDSTGSMYPALAELKRNVKGFLEELERRFGSRLRVRISASGDYQDAGVLD